MLEGEYQFYLKNKKKLLKKYKGKFIIIKDNQVIGAYSNESKAYDDAIKQYKLGTFLIQHCLPESQKIIQTFHSRVIF